MRPSLRSILAVLSATGMMSCAPEKPGETMVKATPSPDTSRVRRVAPADEQAYSNIRRADYVGPQACGDCHPEKYSAWQNHPHSRMNMHATPDAVLGDFSNAVVSYAGGRALFQKEGDAFTASYYRGEDLIRKFRITRTIGWRYEQNYVGVQIHGPEPPGDLLYTEETRLRFGYSFERNQWLPQNFLEPKEYPDPEYKADGSLSYDPFIPDRVPFNQRCAGCHNTYPYDLRFYKIYTGDGMLSGFAPGPGITPQTVQTLAAQVGDLALVEDKALPKDRFVTLGISCESCHFGGREHAVHDTKIRFVPTHPLLADWTPGHTNARKNPQVVNAICRQCHHSGSAKDNWPDGSATVNSMEAVEMDRGGCASQIRCTHCHDTHTGGPNAGAPDRKAHLSACVDCHAAYASSAAAQAHSRHAPDQASCLDCHMPRIVQGFGVYNRTHRIASPTDPKILGTGMPNACNLCHLDKSLAWTQRELETGWGRRTPLSPSLQKQFGPAFERPAGQAWLTHPYDLARVVAAGAYANAPERANVLPRLIGYLNEPNAYIRMRFLTSVETILGRQLSHAEYAPLAPPDEREKQIWRLLAQYAHQKP